MPRLTFRGAEWSADIDKRQFGLGWRTNIVIAARRFHHHPIRFNLRSGSGWRGGD